MAQIDLKFATISLRDGYALAGVIDNAGNYAAGVLTIAVAGLTGAVANGDTFAITGESGTPTHTITGHVEDGDGDTVQVTFTTAIATGGVTNASTVTITKTGAVAADASAAATTIIVNGFTGMVEDGDTFVITGESGTPTHTVTSHAETSGNTTSITFSTALASGGVTATDVITLTRLGTVSGGSGYQTGASTIAVTFPANKAVVTGDTFILAGETNTPTHAVASHTETDGSTTSITFTPALASAVANATAVTLQPHMLVLFIGDGNLTYTEHRAIEYKLNQGLLKYSKLGDQQPMDVSLDFVWEFLTSASGDTSPTPEDAFKQRNLASTWVTSGSDPCEPYALDVVIDYVPPCPGVDQETITLPEFRYEEMDHDPKAAQISMKGKSLVQEATATRTPQD